MRQVRIAKNVYKDDNKHDVFQLRMSNSVQERSNVDVTDIINITMRDWRCNK